MENFFDAHTHVQFAAYDHDRAAVIRRAQEAGIRFINAGTERATSRSAVELAEKNEGVFAAIGLHPTHTGPSFHDADELHDHEAASHGEVFDASYYRELALRPKTVAIGECGLDYFHFNAGEDKNEQIRRQKTAFLAQIALAIEVKKPLVIHCREAFPDLIQILRDKQPELGAMPCPGVIHFFTGTVDDAKQILDLGFSFTFGGAVTFPPRKGAAAGTYDEVVRFLPIDAILSETDAPYLAPPPYRGQRNEPAYVVEVVKKLSDLKGVAVAEMAERIRENARRIFGI